MVNEFKNAIEDQYEGQDLIEVFKEEIQSNKKFTYDIFKSFVEKNFNIVDEYKLKRIFNTLDDNKNGYIEVLEFLNIFSDETKLKGLKYLKNEFVKILKNVCDESKTDFSSLAAMIDENKDNAIN